MALKVLLDQNREAVVIYVPENRQLQKTGCRDSASGAVWMLKARSSVFYRAENARYKTALTGLAGEQTDRPLICV